MCHNKIYYLCGFFYADGYLKSKLLYPTLEIVEDDGKIISNLLNSANIEYTEHVRKRSNSNRQQMILTIRSKDKYISLFRNIMKDKIKMSKAFDLIPVTKQYLFLRGFFDGDGCISLNKNGGSKLYFYGSYYQNWNPISKILHNQNIKYTYQQVSRKNFKHNSSHIYITNKPGIDALFSYIYPNLKFDFGLYRKYTKLLTSHKNIKRKYYERKHKKTSIKKEYS